MKNKVRLARGRRKFKEMALKEGQHFGEITILLPEHVPFRGLAQASLTTSTPEDVLCIYVYDRGLL